MYDSHVSTKLHNGISHPQEVIPPHLPRILFKQKNILLKPSPSDDLQRQHHSDVEVELTKRTTEVAAVQDAALLVLASLAETRDSETGNHLRRTAFYIKALAEKLSSHSRFRRFLTPINIDMLFRSAPLHDIGKIGIPDHILLKPGRYEPHEFEIMKSHTLIGHNSILQVEKQLGVDLPFLSCAKSIILSHHEKWDGSGYPYQLAGDAIPIPARLMAIADVYDALISRRAYKSDMSHQEAIVIMKAGRGTHFDPDIYDAFIEIQSEFIAIAKMFADTNAEIKEKEVASFNSFNA